MLIPSNSLIGEVTDGLSQFSLTQLADDIEVHKKQQKATEGATSAIGEAGSIERIQAIMLEMGQEATEKGLCSTPPHHHHHLFHHHHHHEHFTDPDLVEEVAELSNTIEHMKKRDDDVEGPSDDDSVTCEHLEFNDPYWTFVAYFDAEAFALYLDAMSEDAEESE